MRQYKQTKNKLLNKVTSVFKKDVYVYIFFPYFFLHSVASCFLFTWCLLLFTIPIRESLSELHLLSQHINSSLQFCSTMPSLIVQLQTLSETQPLPHFACRENTAVALEPLHLVDLRDWKSCHEQGRGHYNLWSQICPEELFLSLHRVHYMVFIRQRYCKWLLSTFPHISWISNLQTSALQKF